MFVEVHTQIGRAARNFAVDRGGEREILQFLLTLAGVRPPAGAVARRHTESGSRITRRMRTASYHAATPAGKCRSDRRCET